MTVQQFLQFHAGLSEAIKLWSRTIQALLEVDQMEQYKIGWALCDLQPDAIYIDRAAQEASHE